MASKTSKAAVEEVEVLARANERLKAENEHLKHELGEQPSAFARGWRGLVIGLCVALATALLIVGNLLFWAGNTLVNNDRYVEMVTPLLEDKEIQVAIADYTTVKLFENVNVDQVIQDALPLRAAFLAGPLTGQLQNATEKTLQRVLASDKFQTVWAQSNDKAHEQFISALKNSRGDGTIDLQNVYDRLSQSLSSTKLSFLAGKSLPVNVGTIEIVDASWVPQARTIVNNIDWIKPVALGGIAVASAIAIWLSHSRRRLIIVLASFFAGSMFVSLISFRIMRSIAVSQVAPNYQLAAEHATEIVTKSLVTQTATLLLISLLIVIVAWISGPYRTASATRQRINWLLSGQLHQALFSGNEPGFTRWLAAHKRRLEWAVVALTGIVLLLIHLSPTTVIVSAIIMTVLILLIETLATPQKPKH